MKLLVLLGIIAVITLIVECLVSRRERKHGRIHKWRWIKKGDVVVTGKYSMINKEDTYEVYTIGYDKLSAKFEGDGLASFDKFEFTKVEFEYGVIRVYKTQELVNA